MAQITGTSPATVGMPHRRAALMAVVAATVLAAAASTAVYFGSAAPRADAPAPAVATTGTSDAYLSVIVANARGDRLAQLEDGWLEGRRRAREARIQAIQDSWERALFPQP